ncbi:MULTISPECIES: cysteine hydrolase family protein [Bacillus]|uniref:Cysteine hydrolase n=1 Tax=Bacillus pseudomycoides TaxID=64104 RepID=A0A1Y3MH13_9BACI|nr:cysteine hydrolase family protein [Bacillus pseudomycoides]EOP55514.1 isochorismatase [Bacillus cereus VD136]EOP74059.1 isochorismatase [Bacillus cereus VDM006]EOQ11521.1 isochorismatase [Bacillus cereus VDM021]OOG91759.1 Isochorismatase [Bacillus mycoides]MDF2082149.1 cysteine hydrolase family protein [Bacillus pseudomycoides]
MRRNCVALLIIDVQTGSFQEKQPLYKGKELLENIQLLISKARTAQAPIIYMKYNGKAGSPLERETSGWSIHKSIAPLAEDITLEKNHPDSFHRTSLQQELDERSIKQIVMVGIQTEICVDATCRRAYSLGYNLTLVEDGHSTYDSTILSASQIIDHHNQVIGQWFAHVKPAEQIRF